MLKRSVLDLNFVGGKISSPTVEVNSESVGTAGITLYEIVSTALSEYAAKNEKVVTTIYMYRGPSVNFGDFSYSDFFIVPKNVGVLKFLKGKLEKYQGVKSRYGEYMLPQEGIKSFHLEGGLLWEPEDAINWYSRKVETNLCEESEDLESLDLGGEFLDEEDSLQSDSMEQDDEEYGFLDETTVEAAKTERVKSTSNVRYRAARSDARVGHIKREIERVFGLPAGSVSLVSPDGVALRSDAFIKTLHKRWQE